MRLPNGYGSVYKLSGKRRKPYIARKLSAGMKTASNYMLLSGTTRLNPRHCKHWLILTIILMTFKCQKLLLPKSIKDGIKMNLKMIVINLLSGAMNQHTKMWKLYSMKMADIRPYHLQDVLDSYTNMSYESVHKIKLLFNKLYRWCMNHDCIKRTMLKT